MLRRRFCAQLKSRLLTLSFNSKASSTLPTSPLFSVFEKVHSFLPNPRNGCFTDLPYRCFSSALRPSSVFNRDGNYDERATHSSLTCPGCGVHMQNLDVKQPGYSIKLSEKVSDYVMRARRGLVVVDEAEVSDSVKKGFVAEGEGSEGCEEVRDRLEKPLVCVVGKNRYSTQEIAVSIIYRQFIQYIMNTSAET